MQIPRNVKLFAFGGVCRGAKNILAAYVHYARAAFMTVNEYFQKLFGALLSGFIKKSNRRSKLDPRCFTDK